MRMWTCGSMLSCVLKGPGFETQVLRKVRSFYSHPLIQSSNGCSFSLCVCLSACIFVCLCVSVSSKAQHPTSSSVFFSEAHSLPEPTTHWFSELGCWLTRSSWDPLVSASPVLGLQVLTTMASILHECQGPILRCLGLCGQFSTQ